MESQIYFISMEGRTDYKIGDFTVREDISLPVYVEEGDKFSVDHTNPGSIIAGMIKILMEDLNNDHLDYYRSFIFSLQPEIMARLSSVGYEAEKNQHFQESTDIFKVLLALKSESLGQEQKEEKGERKKGNKKKKKKKKK